MKHEAFYLLNLLRSVVDWDTTGVSGYVQLRLLGTKDEATGLARQGGRHRAV